MIVRKGHYLRGSYCIKCDTQYRSDTDVSMRACFKDPCQGKWKHQVEFLEDLISRSRKELAEVRKWMAHDQKEALRTTFQKGRNR